MKSGFDKIEAFKKALNILTKLNCNVSDAYDNVRAERYLHQLSKAWGKDENHVVLAVVQMAQAEVDARTRFLVQQVADGLQLPITPEEFMERWDNLSEEEKKELVSHTVAVLEAAKRNGGGN